MQQFKFTQFWRNKSYQYHLNSITLLIYEMYQK